MQAVGVEPAGIGPTAAHGHGRRRLPRIHLLEVAPWLGEGMDQADFESASRRLLAPRIVLEQGPQQFPGLGPAVGGLILDGKVARDVDLTGASDRGMEILGSGDLIRPWTFRGPSQSLPSSVTWTVMERLELAVLDRSFAKGIALWPTLAINLLESVVERARALSSLLAAHQGARLESRVLMTLWHLADRWGQTSSDGVILEMPALTHEMLARMVAARRPSVTTCLGRLRALGLLEISPDGRWLLYGDPAAAIARASDG